MARSKDWVDVIRLEIFVLVQVAVCDVSAGTQVNSDPIVCFEELVRNSIECPTAGSPVE